MNKDKIQHDINSLRHDFSNLYNIVMELKQPLNNLRVQECTTCNHETMQVERKDYGCTDSSSMGIAGPYSPHYTPPSTTYYVCLSCGSKFTLVDKKESIPYFPSCDQ